MDTPTAVAAGAWCLALLAVAGPAAARQGDDPRPVLAAAAQPDRAQDPEAPDQDAPGQADPDDSGAVTEFVGAGVQGPELVENGSFEAPQSPRPGLVGNFPSIPGWTETTGHGLEIQNGLARTARNGGAQYVELDSKGPSSIYQDISTVPGRTYRLTFVYAAHPRLPAAESAFEVTFGDTTQAVAPAPRRATVWRTIAMDVVATAPSTRLTFADASGPGRVRGLGVFLDLVSVTQTG